MFTILTVISIILILIYLLEFITIFSVPEKKINHSGNSTDHKPGIDGISLIIPLRNESNNIENLAQTISEFLQPALPFEIILADDFSTDNTFELLEKYCAGIPNVSIIKSHSPSGNLNGKPNALNTGISFARYEIIAVTDADMTLNKKWLQSIEFYFSNNQSLDMICGPTIVRPTNLWGTIQSLDWSYLMTIASSSFNAGNPISAIGNNMVFRKSSYFAVGGYANIPFSITEDFELFRTFLAQKMSVIFPLEADMLHITEPNKTLKAFISQRKRWIRGGMSIHARGMMTLLAGVSAQLAVIISIFTSWIILVFVLGIKITVDLKVLNTFYDRMHLKYRPIHFILFEFYYFCYSLIMPVIFLLSPKVVWKDRTY